jgi:chondroitin AC lyase
MMKCNVASQRSAALHLKFFIFPIMIPSIKKNIIHKGLLVVPCLFWAICLSATEPANVATGKTAVVLSGEENTTSYEPPALDPDKQEAIDSIASRLVAKILTNNKYTNDTNPTAYFNSMQSDGSWSGVDYNDKISLGDWAPATHLSYLITMAVAFRSPTSSWYESSDMQEKIEKGLLFYKTKNPVANDNWWYTDIGDPQKYMIPALLLKGYSSYTTLTDITTYLRDLTDKTSVKGQNLAWCAEIVTYKGCAENNYDLTLKSFNAMANTLKIVSVQGDEGVKTDGSFHQHHAQIYSGGYGLSITGYISASMELATGTMFSSVYTMAKLEIFRNILLNGHRLLGYRSVMDFGTTGRNITRSGTGENISTTVLNRMIVADPEKAADYQAWKEHVQGAAFPAVGNKHFWKSDIMTHHGANYYLSAKIISVRTYGTECLNGENLLGYNLPLGATNILTSGTEYTGIYPVWDWTKIPGTTSAQESAATVMPDNNYLIGSNIFGGGVSNGSAGVIAYEHNYKDLNACKAYFLLGDAMVCLGADIRLNKEVEVATSVNQCLLKGNVIVSHGEVTEMQVSNTVNNYTDLRWVHHDNVGYIFPDDADITVKSQQQQGSWSLINSTGSASLLKSYVFNVAISHGSSPTNDQYCYIVAPGQSLEDFRQYAQNHGYVTVRNDNVVQAVRNDILHKTGIVFHAAATVDLGNGLIVTADKPALVLIEQEGSDYQLSVADPKYNATSVSLTFNKHLSGENVVSEGASTTITFTLPVGDYTGSSITNRYTDKLSDISAAMRNAASQYACMTSLLVGHDRFPKTYNRYLNRLQMSASDWWCSGFYPGTLLYLYEATGKPELMKEARRMLALLEKEQYNTKTHDIGFMMYCSYGNAWRIDPHPKYREILINSAQSLSTRFNPKVGCIKSHNREPEEFIVIADNMMNLELLFWATQATGDSTYHNIAVSHANTTMKNHFRPDNSLYHALNYDPKTGEVNQYIGGQGYSEQSAWSRGQAWGLYGYTMVYRFTKDPKYLEQAIKIAEFQLSHPNMPSDRIPYWDYDAPDIPCALRDASAAAINASGLLELSRYVPETLSGKYIRCAEQILSTLASPEYTAQAGTNGGFILKHSVGNIPAMTEMDVPLTYADYYYVEALKRYKSILINIKL